MKIARIILLLLLWGLMLAGIFWARNKSRDVVCKGIRVEVMNDDELPFVTPQAIKEELARNRITVINRPMWQLNIDKIETALKRSPYIEDAECILSVDGQLLVKVSQIVPVVRVFDGESSYYLNKDGKRMRANAMYHADVPIIRGHFTDRYPATRLLPLVQYVNADSALSALVTMYNVQDSNNIFIVPSIYGHVVNFGNLDNIEGKFDKLRLFYRKVMPERGWMTFDTLSVKWNHQVVATRRVKKVETVIEYSAEDNEPEADMATVMMGDDAPAETAVKADSKKDENAEKRPEMKPEKKAEPAKAEKKKEQNKNKKHKK
ncbi:MAG: hypothetical protein IJ835_08340 [Muribaculaceae bacterium]|nr:hypothetical protein [Muribaculaceae bacterium]